LLGGPPSPPSTRTVYRSRLDRGVTTSLPATFFEGLLIRKAHPFYALYGTLSFILSYSGYFIPLCLCDSSIRCTRIHSLCAFVIASALLVYLGGAYRESLGDHFSLVIFIF
jgi:hypothetical protein